MMTLKQIQAKRASYITAKVNIEGEFHEVMVKYNPTLANEFLSATFHKELNIKAFIGGFNDCATKEFLCKLKEEYDIVKKAILICNEMIEIKEMAELSECL